MAALSKAESRRLYSWWWDSHISPKNSKWLKQNLTDMDFKVKSMIKLIEEDADSFARRAEMYYKKRPELMKLVEEFYRAYRALAERYDHATGALRQAQKTMSEAFPNQIPFAISDESPSGSTSADFGPFTPDDPPSSGSVFDADDFPKEFSSPSSPFNVKKNGAYSDGVESVTSKKGMKQLTEFFSDNRARKGLNFQEDEAKGSENEKRNGGKGLRKLGKGDDESSQKIKKLQGEISELSDENQSLKMQVKTETQSRSKAESELQWLEKAHSKLKGEREEAVQKFQQSLRRIYVLEAEIESFNNQKSDMLAKISTLHNSESKCVTLEKEKKSLQMEIGTLKEKSNEQQHELAHKEEELEKLKIAIKDEHIRCVHAEAALESIQTLYDQSVEALRISALEIQNGVKMLKETESKKQILESELQNARLEIQNLNDENVSARRLIETHQDESLSLKAAQKKLEDEVERVSEGKKSLEQEIYRLEKEITDLLQSHKCITDQIEAVGLNEKSFQSTVKDLQDANIELKDLCNKKEHENVLILKKLEKMQEISERSAFLDNSLSGAKSELDELRSKIKTLQDTSDVLKEKNSALECEKTLLVSKEEMLVDNITNLSEKNTLLECSLADAVVELESLRGNLKSLEQSFQSLEEDKSNLQNKNASLIFQVELMGNRLEDLKKSYTELHDKHSSLEKEGKIKSNESTELQHLLTIKRQQYETFVDSSNAKLSSLEAEIHRLIRNRQCREEEFMEEQHKFFASQIEIFILQRCIQDLKERKSVVSKEWQKQEQYILRQQEKEGSLLDRIERLKRVIHMVWGAINTNDAITLVDGSEELSLQFILDKIKAMQTSVRDAEDERQSLLLEKSVYITLLQQLGHHMTDLRSEKNYIYQECRKKTDDLLLLEREKHDLMDINSQLRYESEAGLQREETMSEEMKILEEQRLKLEEAQSETQHENQKLLKENQLLSSKFSNLKEDIHLLQDEYSAIFERASVLDTLLLVFAQFSSDKITEVKMLNNELARSHKIKYDLEEKVTNLSEKSKVVEAENAHLKELAFKLEDCRDHLTILAVDMSMAKTVNEELNSQIEQLGQLVDNRNSSLIQKDMVISEAHENFQDLQQNTQLYRSLEDIKTELNEVKVVRYGLEQKIVTFLENMANKEKEISFALEANEMLRKELKRLHKENGDLRMKEKESTSRVLNEVSCCEEEFAGLCNGIQEANVHAVLFEEKVLELMKICESLKTRKMVEGKNPNEEVFSKTAKMEELIVRVDDLEGENREMRSELNEYMLVISSLGTSISSLENLIIQPNNRHASKDDPTLKVSQGSHGNRIDQGDDQKSEVPHGVVELQKLLEKVEALRKFIVATKEHSAPHHINGGASKMVATNVDESGAISKHNRASTTDSAPSASKDELMMKDIQLDHVSSSSRYDVDDDSYQTRGKDNTENDEQMLKLWETVDRNSKKKRNSSLFSGDSITDYYPNRKNDYPSSELTRDEESGVDKLEVPKKANDFHHSWNREVAGRLSSDSERISVLQKGVHELKKKVDRSEEQNIPKSFEFDTIKMQLQESEASIMRLVETNRKLIKMAQDCSTSSGSKADEEEDETKALKKRLVSERARRGSDKIERLELELQKTQNILHKLEEEYESHRKRAMSRRSRVLLKDYLYGRRERRRRKSLCCMSGTISDD